MPQNFLNYAQICLAFKKMGGAGVPKAVAIAFDTEFFEISGDVCRVFGKGNYFIHFQEYVGHDKYAPIYSG